MPGRANRIHARIRALYRNDEASPTSLGLHFMKTKAIVATLLVAAAARADARFASPYPRKAVSPDVSGHWIVINSNPWSRDVESELVKQGQNTARRGTASLGAAPKNRGRDFTFCETFIFERPFIFSEMPVDKGLRNK
jgi:hypothetical protein